MYRNIYGALCVNCQQGVGKEGGFIYKPGGRNAIVCDQCAHRIVGQHLGLLRAPASSESDTAAD